MVVRVKDCGYVKVSELTDDDLAREGLPQNLSAEERRVILRRILHVFDTTKSYDDTSYVFRMSFEKIVKI
jgi:hypothetical protein